MSVRHYRYAQVEGRGTIGLREAKLIEPRPTDILLRVAYCGICGTDVAILAGTRNKRFPYLPGHEYTGIVEQVGAQVARFKRGDRVVGNPNYVCGACYFCKRGEQHLCDSADEPHYSNGAFADYLSIDSRYVYHIPPGVSLRDAALTESLACALHAVNHVANQAQRLALVIGSGTMGLLITEAIRHLRLADVVAASEPVAAKRVVARRLGADVVVGSDARELQEAVRAINPVGADVVFECSGTLAATHNALHVVRRGGTIVLVGRTAEDDRLNIQPCHVARKAITIAGSSRYVPAEFEQAIAWLAQGAIHPQEYFGREFALAELATAFEHARAGKDIKTLIRCC